MGDNRIGMEQMPIRAVIVSSEDGVIDIIEGNKKSVIDLINMRLDELL